MWSIPSNNIIAVAFPAHFHEAPQPQLDVLMLFGFLCALATLVCYLEQSRSRSFILALAICSALLAAFAFLKDAWPVGIVELIWSATTVRRWWTVDRSVPSRSRKPSLNSWPAESRISRLFDHEVRCN
jgi:hypothetical protein